MRKLALLILLLPLLGGCDQFREALDLPPSPEKENAATEAEAKAIGGACRQAGRSLEDCYLLNAEARKAAIFDGWKEMNDYMQAKELPVVPSKIPHPGEFPIWPRNAPGIPPLPDASPSFEESPGASAS